MVHVYFIRLINPISEKKTPVNLRKSDSAIFFSFFSFFSIYFITDDINENGSAVTHKRSHGNNN